MQIISQNCYNIVPRDTLRKVLKERHNKIKDLYKTSINIENEYSNKNLSNSLKEFAEAVSLIWISDKL
ncbi:MAG TPA: hypothetical protein PK772_03255 [Chitinophagaceae bacterium]|nr:hypothetical protein [Chitinophagaceae bacterium]